MVQSVPRLKRLEYISQIGKTHAAAAFTHQWLRFAAEIVSGIFVLSSETQTAQKHSATSNMHLLV